jgi:hypothetical protein
MAKRNADLVFLNHGKAFLPNMSFYTTALARLPLEQQFFHPDEIKSWLFIF